MAKLIEKPQQAEVDDLVETQQETQETPQEQTPELPDKYRNKSIEEIVRMHQEAEKALGRQGAEVGELRKVVDEFILSKKQETPVKDIDFFEKPQEAVQKLLENHPSIKEAKEVSEQFKKQTALTQLQRLHPDMFEIINNPQFQQWVGSSKVRTEMLRKADVEFDFEMADELFSSWKERKQVAKQAEEVEKQSRKKAVANASTGASAGSGEKSSKKIYRRADIIELMKTDPNRYMALEPEIQLAYREGRVR